MTNPKITALIEARVRRYGYTVQGSEAEVNTAKEKLREELTEFADQVQRIVWEAGSLPGDDLPVVE